MLGLGGFNAPPQPLHLKTISQNSIPSPLHLFPAHTHLSFSTFGLVLGQTPNGLCAFGLKGPRNQEIQDFDDEEEMEDEDDEDMVVPLRNMKQWLENKPRGFGEGKEYDTSIEDKLFEEMEQSRIAQLANLNNLKNNPQHGNSNKENIQKQKVAEAIPDGIRVRVVNLPKKKNIHRDLQLAFKGARGLLNIIPSVSGNKKTREPICKGTAFVYFKSDNEAKSFVQTFTGQSIAFGKIQKQIKCEIVNNPNPEQVAYKTNTCPRLAVRSLEEETFIKSDFKNPFLDSREENVANEHDGADDEHVTTILEDTQENLRTFRSSELSGGDRKEERKDSATNSLPSNQQEKIQENGKELVARRKAEKVPKLKMTESANGEQRKESSRISVSSKQEKTVSNGKKQVAKKKGEKILKQNIPGSAKSLRLKEKSVLTDVFSKYGAKSAMAVKEQS